MDTSRPDAVVAAMTTLLRRMATSRLGPHSRLVATVGTFTQDAGTFVPFVSLKFFQDMLWSMEGAVEAGVWSTVTRWAHSVERTFPLVGDDTAIATCRVWASDTEPPGQPTLQFENFVARDGGHVDMTWTHPDPRRLPAHRDVRVAVIEEAPCADEELPEFVQPTRTRVRQSCGYTCTPLGAARPVWAFNFSLVWDCGSCLASNDVIRFMQEPLMEVTLECIRPLEYLKSVGGDAAYVSKSLSWKVADLFDDAEPGTLEHVGWQGLALRE